MNPRTLFFCLLFTPFSLWSQETGSPYNPKADYETWSIKFKALPFLIGNGAGVSGFLGLEYSFLKNMSIGVDGYLLLQESSSDQIPDTAGVEHNTGNYCYSVERAVLVDYRYYFNFPRLRARGVVFYTLVYARLGHIFRHWDPLYPHPFVTQNETHHSMGLSLGSTFSVDKESRWCLDINAGIFEKDKTITSVDVANHRVTEKPVGPGPRVSVNLCYWFTRARKVRGASGKRSDGWGGL